MFWCLLVIILVTSSNAYAHSGEVFIIYGIAVFIIMLIPGCLLFFIYNSKDSIIKKIVKIILGFVVFILAYALLIPVLGEGLGSLYFKMTHTSK